MTTNSPPQLTTEFIAKRLVAVSALAKNAEPTDLHPSVAMVYLFSILPHVVAAGPDPVLNVTSLNELVYFANALKGTKDLLLTHTRDAVDSFLIRLPGVDRDESGALTVSNDRYFSKVANVALYA